MFRVITKKNILAYDSFRWLSLNSLNDWLADWLDGMRIAASHRVCCSDVCYTHFVAAWLNCTEHVTVLFPICSGSETFGNFMLHTEPSMCQLFDLVSKFRERMSVKCVCTSTRHIARMGSDEFCRYNLHTKIQLNFVPCFIENLNNHIHTYYTF